MLRSGFCIVLLPSPFLSRNEAKGWEGNAPPIISFSAFEFPVCGCAAGGVRAAATGEAPLVLTSTRTPVNGEVRERNKEGKSELKKSEADFIAIKGSQKYYVQSAFEMPSQDKTVKSKRDLTALLCEFMSYFVCSKVRHDGFCY